MLNRTNSRIIAMMVLYNQDINQDLEFDSIIDLINDELKEENNNIEFDIDFVKTLVNGVNNHLEDIDYELSIAIEKYTLDRISFVDRSLLRIGAFEILFNNTPKEIVINEIVNISKEYSEIENYRTSKFNNAILDKLNKR